jgi:hypothetical protein
VGTRSVRRAGDARTADRCAVSRGRPVDAGRASLNRHRGGASRGFTAVTRTKALCRARPGGNAVNSTRRRLDVRGAVTRIVGGRGSSARWARWSVVVRLTPGWRRVAHASAALTHRAASQSILSSTFRARYPGPSDRSGVRVLEPRCVHWRWPVVPRSDPCAAPRDGRERQSRRIPPPS